MGRTRRDGRGGIDRGDARGHGPEGSEARLAGKVRGSRINRNWAGGHEQICCTRPSIMGNPAGPDAREREVPLRPELADDFRARLRILYWRLWRNSMTHVEDVPGWCRLRFSSSAAFIRSSGNGANKATEPKLHCTAERQEMPHPRLGYVRAPVDAHHEEGGVETSLDTARTSACATAGSRAPSPRRLSHSPPESPAESHDPH